MTRLAPELYAQIVRLTPLTSIDLIVRNRRGQMLLGLRRNRPAQGSWFVPGSRFGKNETIAAAFTRITADELGREMSVSEARFLGVFEHFYDDNFSTDPSFGTHYVVLAYALDVDPESLAPPDDQHRDYLWLDDRQMLSRDDVHPNTRAYCGL